MKRIFYSLLIGAFAGIIDVIPMIIQKLDWYSNISAFMFWVIMGLIIAHISLPIKNWLKGLIVSLLSAIPIMILVFANDPKSVIPMLASSVILGSLVGITTGKYAK